MKIAYIINQYPIISTTFIRREILALERQGVEVQRIAVRGWDAKFVSKEDEDEQLKTRYVLQDGFFYLLFMVLRTAAISPLRFSRALRLTITLGWRADRPLLYHLIYLAESCCVLAWVRAAKSAHMHAHFGTNAAEVAALVNALGGPPYSFTVHGPVEFDSPQFLKLNHKAKNAKFICAISSFARGQLFRWIDPRYWEKVHVVRCGLEESFYKGTFSRPVASSRLVCVGRLSPEKGQLLLVHAANDLAKKGKKFQLVLVGGGESQQSIQELIAEYGLQEHVRLTGWLATEAVREQILESRVLVSASVAEGLPVVIMEAMALRRPVLATAIAGVPELVRHGETGWLVPSGSIESLAKAIEDILECSTSELHKIGDAAYAEIVKQHSVDTEVLKLKKLFMMKPGQRARP